jgi:hypothetical protein
VLLKELESSAVSPLSYAAAGGSGGGACPAGGGFRKVSEAQDEKDRDDPTKLVLPANFSKQVRCYLAALVCRCVVE